jgi:hypothetical protein
LVIGSSVAVSLRLLKTKLTPLRPVNINDELQKGPTMSVKIRWLLAAWPVMLTILLGARPGR